MRGNRKYPAVQHRAGSKLVIRAKNHLSVRIFSSGNTLALAVADRVCAVAEERRSEGRPLVLGLAAGASPQEVYRDLVLRVQSGQLDFSQCLLFCLDEYYPVHPQDPRSYTKRMSSLAAELGISKGNFRIPRGDIPREQIELHCEKYEQEIRSAGGIDFELLGVGRSGHIGFNEPGALAKSRTRLVQLDERTRKDAVSSFGGLNGFAREAITMGIGTILEAKEIALIALGAHKAAIVRRLIEEPPSPAVPASFLQTHDCATVYLDEDAASEIVTELSVSEC